VSDGFVGGVVAVAEIVAATSLARPRADVAYCIHALARRLAKTRNWIVSTVPLWLRLFHPCCVLDVLVVALSDALQPILY
jgi:hypothetical protein